MTIDLQALLDSGFELAKLNPGREPDATTRLFYNATTLTGTTLPPSANVAVRKSGVFAIRYCDPPQGSTDAIQHSVQFQTLRSARSLFVHSAALVVAAFEFSSTDYVTEGIIGVGPLRGCRIITPPRGFIIQGTVDVGARSFRLQSEGTLKRPTEELAAILYPSGLFRAASEWSA